MKQIGAIPPSVSWELKQLTFSEWEKEVCNLSKNELTKSVSRKKMLIRRFVVS